MKTLQKDWLTQGWLDLEYKRFVVLAYLQEVQRHFSDKKFYPDLTELRDHYDNGLHFRNRKGTLSASFPKEVSGINPETLSFRYTPAQEDDTFIQQIDAIVDFALPRFERALNEGQQVADEIEAGLSLTPIGMLPLQREEGYLFLHWTAHSQTHIYYFCRAPWPRLTTVYTSTGTSSRPVRTQYIDSVRKGIGQPFEMLKLNLIRQRPHLPNPATFMIESKRKLPLEQTLLPMARRLVARQAFE